MIGIISRLCESYFDGFRKLDDDEIPSGEKWIPGIKVASYFATLGLLPGVCAAFPKIVCGLEERRIRAIPLEITDADKKLRTVDDIFKKIIIDVADPEVFFVCKQFAAFREDEDIWKAIANRLPWLDVDVKAAKGSWRHAFQIAHKKYKAYILNQFPLPQDIEEIAQRTVISIEDMETLHTWKGAKDLLVIQNRLAAAIGRNVYNLAFLKTKDEWMTKSQEVCEWFHYSDVQAALSQLRELNLSNCKLSSLPPEIGMCTQLEILYLQKNQLQTLPEEMGNLGQLAHLDLQKNHLVALTEGIGNCTNLLWLNLEKNHLPVLPKGIGKLAHLNLLNAQKNRLSILPREVGSLGNLRLLDLRKNDLESLPEEMAALGNLKTLLLNDNRLLSALPSQIKKLMQNGCFVYGF